MKKSFTRGRTSSEQYNYVSKIIRETVKSVLSVDGDINVTKKNIVAYIINGDQPSSDGIVKIADLVKPKIITLGRGKYSTKTSYKKVKFRQLKHVKNSQSEVYEVINFIKNTKIIAQTNKKGPFTDDPGPSKAQ